MNKIKIAVETISPDSKKVWEFWTIPKHIRSWNFASQDWSKWNDD